MKISEIPSGQIFGICASNINAAISGAYKAAFYPTGKVTLVYVDGEKETAQFTVDEAQGIVDEGLENWFAIVSAVQSKRKADGRE